MTNAISEPLHVASASAKLPDVSRNKLSVIFQWIEDACVFGAAFLTPLFFFTGTLEVLEIHKQTLFLLLIILATISWVGKGFAEKKFSLSRSWLHLCVLVFGIGFFLTSLVSDDRASSFIGATGQASWAFITVAGCVLLYSLLARRVRDVAYTYRLIFSFLLSSLVAGLYGIAQMLGRYALPYSITQSKAFTSVGSSYGLVMYSAVILVLAAALIFQGCRAQTCVFSRRGLIGVVARVVLWASVAVHGAILVFADLRTSWICLFVGTALLLVGNYYHLKKAIVTWRLILPGILLAGSLLFFFVPSPLKADLPGEIAPNATMSWDIARQALQATPFFGSGPLTWSYDYAKFRSPLINASPFWSTRFDRSYSTFFTLLATIGIVGLCCWLVLILGVCVRFGIAFHSERREDVWHVTVAAGAAWATSLMVLFFYNAGMAHQVLFWILLGLIGGLTASTGWEWEARRSKVVNSVFTVVGLVTIVLGLIGIWLVGQRWAAEFVFSRAVRGFEAGTPVAQVVSDLDTAQSLNPFADTYVRYYSQARLINALQLAKAQPSGDNAGQVRTEIAQAINYGLKATEKNGANEDNWSNLGLIYQSVSSMTDNAINAEIKNYTEAHNLNPLNPVYTTEIGKAYLQLVEKDRTLIDSSDTKVSGQARADMKSHLESAARWLHESVGLKSDYLEAQYYLGVVYERQGQISEAIREIESVLQVRSRDVGLAFELAILYYRNGEKPRALNLLEQVVRSDPSNANASWYLASMYEEQGRLKDALALLVSLSNQMKENTAIQQRIEHLRQALNAQQPAAVAPKPTLPEPLPVVPTKKSLAPKR